MINSLNGVRKKLMLTFVGYFLILFSLYFIANVISFAYRGFETITFIKVPPAVIGVFSGIYGIYLASQIASLIIHKRMFNFWLISIFRFPWFAKIEVDNKFGLDVIWNFILLSFEVFFVILYWQAIDGLQ